jgi:hypothetical protein
MAGGNGGPPPELFTKMRAIGGLAFCAAAVIIAVIDALRVDVEINGFQFFLLCGTGALLLGVQGIERFMKP